MTENRGMSVHVIYRKNHNNKLNKRAKQSNIPKAQTASYKFMNFGNSNSSKN